MKIYILGQTEKKAVCQDVFCISKMFFSFSSIWIQIQREYFCSKILASIRNLYSKKTDF